MDLLNLVGLKRIEDSVNKLAAQQAAQAPADYVPPAPKEVYLSWEAESRVTKQATNQKLTRTVMVIGGVIALFLVVLQEYFLILVIASAIFVSSVLTKTPPQAANYEISSYGVTVNGVLYTWGQLKKFFFIFDGGNVVLAIDTTQVVPSRLFLSLGSIDQNKVKSILEQHMPYLASAPKDTLDKTFESFRSKFSI